MVTITVKNTDKIIGGSDLLYGQNKSGVSEWIGGVFGGETHTAPTTSTSTLTSTNTGLVIGVGVVIVLFMFITLKFM